jgi:hypothetical protein
MGSKTLLPGMDLELFGMNMRALTVTKVLPSVVKYVRDEGLGQTREPSEPHTEYSGHETDGALAALLRCIVHQTGAEVAMVSLLDDHTQYFVSGASRASVHDANVTLGEYIHDIATSTVIHSLNTQ